MKLNIGRYALQLERQNNIDQKHVDKVLMSLRAMQAQLGDYKLLAKGEEKTDKALGLARGDLSTLENYINSFAGRGFYNYSKEEWQKDDKRKSGYFDIESEAGLVLENVENAAYGSRELRKGLLEFRNKFKNFANTEIARLGGYEVRTIR